MRTWYLPPASYAGSPRLFAKERDDGTVDFMLNDEQIVAQLLRGDVDTFARWLLDGHDPSARQFRMIDGQRVHLDGTPFKDV